VLVVAGEQARLHPRDAAARCRRELLTDFFEIAVIDLRREVVQRLHEGAPQFDARPSTGDRLRLREPGSLAGPLECGLNRRESAPTKFVQNRMRLLHLVATDDRRVGPRTATDCKRESAEAPVLRDVLLDLGRLRGAECFDRVGCTNTIALQIARLRPTTEFVYPTRGRDRLDAPPKPGVVEHESRGVELDIRGEASGLKAHKTVPKRLVSLLRPA
jgi:hypothetical protein